MHQLPEKIISKAKSNLKHIILAEGDDIRIIKAASLITQEKIAQITLLGNPSKINDKAEAENIDLKNINIIDPQNYSELGTLADNLYEIRKAKGLSKDESMELIKNPLYFGTMLVKTGFADGMVAGSNCPTANVLKPALQIIKAAPDQKIVSTFFIIISPDTQFGENGILFFADCSMNINPNAEELANIATQTADSFKFFIGKTPKVAMLSFSTNGSGCGDMVTKVQEATTIAQLNRPDLLIEGELQADAAIVPNVSKLKQTQSQISGSANILIFPDLNTANISYKLVQRLAKADAFGPITQGMNKPINDLSRGCSVDDIVVTVAITSIQAESETKEELLLNKTANL
jgi:phosphate acetyltransferase